MPVWITSKLIGYTLLSVLGIAIALKAWNMLGNYFNEVENTRIELSNERIKRERADTSLALLRNTVELEDTHELAVKQIREEYQNEIFAIRTEAEQQIAVLEDRERFQKVVNAKPGLVEKLANKATKERFDELEIIFNN